MRYLTLLLLLICVQNSFAQFDTWGIRAGVAAGSPIPTRMDTNFIEVTGSPGLNPVIGVFGRYKFSERFSLQAELNFSQKRTSYTQFFQLDSLAEATIAGQTVQVPTIVTISTDGAMKLSALDVPIMAQYGVGASKNLKIIAGVQGSVLIGGEDAGLANATVGTGLLLPDTIQAFNNYPQDMNKWEFSVTAGVLYDFPFGLGIDFRAIRGLTGMYRKGFLREQGLEEIPAYYTSLQLAVSYRFK